MLMIYACYSLMGIFYQLEWISIRDLFVVNKFYFAR
jgi:hypothetical protein